MTDALWAIDDHHHATKASITADQKFQSIERNMSVSKNIDIIPQCEGCLMWRLFYSKHSSAKVRFG